MSVKFNQVISKLLVLVIILSMTVYAIDTEESLDFDVEDEVAGIVMSFEEFAEQYVNSPYTEEELLEMYNELAEENSEALMIKSSDIGFVGANIHPDAYKYNFKKGFDESSEILSSVTWKAPKGENYPTAPKLAQGVQGKYGNCIALSYYMYSLEDMSGQNYFPATVSMSLPTSKMVLKAGTPYQPRVEADLGDAVYGFKNLGFWLKYETNFEGNPANSTRKFTINLSTAAGTYKCDITFTPTYNWQYIVIPAAMFKKGDISITDSPDDILGFKGMDIGATPSNIFGGSPTAEDIKWEREYMATIYLDELTFDKTTASVRPYTRPSDGELAYSRDNRLKSININGSDISNIGVYDGTGPLEIELPYGFLDGTKDEVEANKKTVTLETMCPDVPIVNTLGEQIKMGSIASITYPETVPGTGAVVVTAASGEQRVYDANFRYGAPFKVEDPSGIVEIREGNIRKDFRVTNCSQSPKDAMAIGVLRDKSTLEILQIVLVSTKDIPADATATLARVIVSVPAVEKPEDLKKYVVEYYFYDNLTNMNKIANTIYLGK